MKKLVNAPNLVSASRVALIPLIVGVFYFPDGWLSYDGRNIVATAVFIFAAITDWLDGYLARKLDQMSKFGAFLDPVADKLVVVGALIVLLNLGRIDMVVGLIIIGREVVISALREWMATVGKAKSVAVAYVGKVKTVVQMIAIPLLLYDDWLFGVDCRWWGTVFINVAAVLTVMSMLYYMRKALPHADGDAG